MKLLEWILNKIEARLQKKLQQQRMEIIRLKWQKVELEKIVAMQREKNELESKETPENKE